jgi:hypothetical protein
MALEVVSAVYGALKNSDSDSMSAGDVTTELTTALANSPNGEVKISNQTLRDTARGVRKHFGAIVKVDGTPRAFACEEGQTIDFS